MSGVVKSVYSRDPLDESALLEIDAVLAQHADQIERTRKGKVWELSIGDFFVDVQILEQSDPCYWEGENYLLEIGLLPEPGYYCVLLSIGRSGDEAQCVIARLSLAIARAIGGFVFAA